LVTKTNFALSSRGSFVSQSFASQSPADGPVSPAAPPAEPRLFGSIENVGGGGGSQSLKKTKSVSGEEGERAEPAVEVLFKRCGAAVAGWWTWITTPPHAPWRLRLQAFTAHAVKKKNTHAPCAAKANASCVIHGIRVKALLQTAVSVLNRHILCRETTRPTLTPNSPSPGALLLLLRVVSR